MNASSVNSSPSYASSLYDNVYMPVKNAVVKAGDEIGGAVDTAVDAVKSAATTVGDDIAEGAKAVSSTVGNFVNTVA